MHITIERDGGEHEVISDPTPPWEMSVRQAGQWCAEHFGFTPFACLPLKLPAMGTEGVAFIMGTGSVPGQATYHDVYIRRMLVGHRITNILPEWAYFARVVLNTEILKPTASREQLFDDELLDATRIQLGEQIQSWLQKLANENPELFENFVSLHIHGLKALAVTDTHTRAMVVRAVPFPTSQGMVPLQQVMDRAGQILFVPTQAEYRTVLPIVRGNGLTVVYAGDAFDEELLAQVALDSPHVPVRRLHAAEIIGAMSPLGASEEAPFLPLIAAAEEALASQRVSVLVRRFHPVSVPVVYLPDEGGAGRQIEERLHNANDLMGQIVASAGRARIRAAHSPGAQLVLNADCAVINQLSGVSDRHQLTRSAIRGLYVQALLAGHHPLTTQARSWSSSALTTLISLSLAGSSP
ncbi:heat shock protein 90 [Corynebacterium ciconiae DSM 44920]|uniref:hypothetical protein n=1 Tax=Corynebacterium ciconiae TaxID=227319 RepID=UPI0012EADEFE|nr:hypothetical protein [Corynebacterium ciconiae]WKD61737.1 heat shock protein 90 [Corynebacterium ciconiae DSM 44920]